MAAEVKEQLAILWGFIEDLEIRTAQDAVSFQDMHDDQYADEKDLRRAMRRGAMKTRLALAQAVLMRGPLEKIEEYILGAEQDLAKGTKDAYIDGWNARRDAEETARQETEPAEGDIPRGP